MNEQHEVIQTCMSVKIEVSIDGVLMALSVEQMKQILAMIKTFTLEKG